MSTITKEIAQELLKDEETFKDGNLIIPENYTTIEELAFNDDNYICSSAIKSICFSNVTTIEALALQNCDNLTKIEGNKITELGGFAFRGCRKLDSVVLPMVEKIGACAFMLCGQITEIELKCIEKMNDNVFIGCDKLTSIYTASNDQCKLIFDNLGEDVQERVKCGQCKIFFNDDTWDPTCHLKEVEKAVNGNIWVPTRHEEAMEEDMEHVFSDFLKTIRVSNENILSGEKCKICSNELQHDDLVSIIDEEKNCQVHESCLLSELMKPARKRGHACRYIGDIEVKLPDELEKTIYSIYKHRYL